MIGLVFENGIIDKNRFKKVIILCLSLFIVLKILIWINKY